MKPRVSLILPCRNEARHIESCLASLAATGYPPDRLELLVVDGRSEDRTRAIVLAWIRTHPWIRLLDNPDRIVPTALNIGIAAATGDVIARVDAHAIYPPEYLPKLVAALATTGADNVGGCVVTLPANPSAEARAVALALGHPFGMGNSWFRIGSARPRWVDTVPFGCYRRAVFRRIGVFDEELVRNQDDEFNHRLIRAGGKVLLVPEVFAYYYARPSRRLAARMLYQYGYFKPLVARKVGRVVTARQLAPPALVAGLVIGAALAPFSGLAAALWLALSVAYAGVTLASAVSAARREGFRCTVELVKVFPWLHFAYGIGFLRGIWDLLVRRGRPWRDPAAVSLTR